MKVDKFVQVLFCLCLASKGEALYFPMSDIHLNLPGNRIRLKNSTKPLFKLEAITDTEQIPYSVRNFVYLGNYSELLKINASNGDVRFDRAFFETENKDIRDLSVTAIAQDYIRNEARTTVHIGLSNVSHAGCDMFLKDLCFWQSATYRLYENRGPTVLGTLSSPLLIEFCSGYRVTYTLIEGKGFIETGEGPDGAWILKTTKPLERDIHRGNRKKGPAGTNLNVNIKCSILSQKGNKTDFEKNMSIGVIDEDDNPPISPNPNTVYVYLDENSSITKGECIKDRVIFTDRDSKPVNRYDFKLIGDEKGLFKLECNTTDDDRENEFQTVIYCKICFNKSGFFDGKDYTVEIFVNDTTMLSGYGDRTANVKFGLRHMSIAPEQMISATHYLYPHDNYSILRTASPFARIAQPKRSNSTNFTIHHKTGDTYPFEITPDEGIVYVHNITALKFLPKKIRITITWREQTGDYKSDSFWINIESESNHTCQHRDNITNWSHCAKNNNPKSCTSSCGLSTGGSPSVESINSGQSKRCVWRGERNPGNAITALYSTCTPDPKTCPDFYCDSLEKLHYLICPQDCSENIMQPAIVNSLRGRGIERGPGVCVCDEHGKCTCLPRTPNVRKPVEKIEAESTTSEEPRSENVIMKERKQSTVQVALCGTTCIVGIATGLFFLVAVIGVIIIYWRHGNTGKIVNRERKYVDNVTSLSGLQTDYANRTIQANDTLTLNFTMNTSPLPTSGTRMAPDPKWEFPRSKLHIEQTLGEGEFGKVLKAKAEEVADLPGYTTVAVKTLKADAREPELADLMSEYELLKEVNHPNVIKLLGACTLPGGPFYLIIEFAEHGSLRNYLRRSRHLEAEGQMPCTQALLDSINTEAQNKMKRNSVCEITPRDILSFAWQICKGMAYLCDVKLVHRDLAARNVLLATGKVCKISDFGLTRDVYEDDAYLKRSKGRVPVKWMAPESLADHVYTSKSDVWSFGILLWELVTLGASPYPGVVVHNLFSLLKSGYRMERPDNCSPALYKIMKSCWAEDPNSRPTFRNLTVQWESMLAEGVDYLDLTPRVVHNRTYFSAIPDDNEDDNVRYGNLAQIKSNSVNYLSKQTEPLTKCAESDKLQQLWETQTRDDLKKYQNETPMSANQYESPIKVKQKFEITEQPLSYVDMAGTKHDEETALLDEQNYECDNKEVSKVTTV